MRGVVYTVIVLICILSETPLSPIDVGIQYAFNRSYFLYTVCRSIVFENEYASDPLVTHDNFVRKRITELRNWIKDIYGSDVNFQVFRQAVQTEKRSQNIYANYQRTMGLDGIDLLNAFLFMEEETHRNPAFSIIRKLLDNKKIRGALKDIEAYIARKVIVRYNRLVIEIGRENHFQEIDNPSYKPILVNYSVASFGETGGLYSSKRRVIMIPDITNSTIFLNEFFHVISFDNVKYNSRSYDSLAAVKFWLNFKRPMNIVLFPFPPIELIDNFLAYRYSAQKGNHIITTPPYLHLFYTSYTPYLSKVFLANLYMQFEDALIQSESYEEFIRKALALFIEYHDRDVEQIVYSEKSRIADFFSGRFTGIHLVDGDINSSRREKRTFLRRISSEFSRRYRVRYSRQLYQRCSYRSIQEMKKSVEGYRTIILISPDNFIRFIEATFIFVPSLERIHPRARNLHNICRAYHQLKNDSQIHSALVYYFGVLLVIFETYRDIPDFSKMSNFQEGVYVVKKVSPSYR
jgi:hypothetical protein